MSRSVTSWPNTSPFGVVTISVLPIVTTKRSCGLNAALAPVNLNAGPMSRSVTSWPNTSPFWVVTMSLLPIVTTKRSCGLNAALAPVNLNAGPMSRSDTSWPNTSPFWVVTMSVLPIVTTKRSCGLNAALAPVNLNAGAVGVAGHVVAEHVTVLGGDDQRVADRHHETVLQVEGHLDGHERRFPPRRLLAKPAQRNRDIEPSSLNWDHDAGMSTTASGGVQSLCGRRRAHSPRSHRPAGTGDGHVEFRQQQRRSRYEDGRTGRADDLALHSQNCIVPGGIESTSTDRSDVPHASTHPRVRQCSPRTARSAPAPSRPISHTYTSTSRRKPHRATAVLARRSR